MMKDRVKERMVNGYKEPIIGLDGSLLPGICPNCLGKGKVIQRFKTFANLKYKNVPCRRCGGSGTVKVYGDNNVSKDKGIQKT